jgi:hypothetical protein
MLLVLTGQEQRFELAIEALAAREPCLPEGHGEH